MGLVPGPWLGQAKRASCSLVESTRTGPGLARCASVGMAGLGCRCRRPGLAGGYPAWHLPLPVPFPTHAAGAFHPVSHSRCRLSLGDDFTLITLIKRH